MSDEDRPLHLSIYQFAPMPTRPLRRRPTLKTFLNAEGREKKPKEETSLCHGHIPYCAPFGKCKLKVTASCGTLRGANRRDCEQFAPSTSTIACQHARNEAFPLSMDIIKIIKFTQKL